MHRITNFFLVLALLLPLVGTPACSSKEGKATKDKTTTPAPAPAAGGQAKKAKKPKASVTDLLRKMRVRQACNRVMGCPPGVALFQFGKQAVGPMVDILKKAGSSDGYWVIKVMSYLGQLGDARALPILHEMLRDPRTEVHSRAAMALARIGSKTSLAPLQKVVAEKLFPTDLGFRVAVLWALDRVGPPTLKRRAEANTLFPANMDALGKRNPLALMIFVDVAAMWPLPAAAPTLRLLARHVGMFIRRGAVRALTRLKDKGAIPVLVGRLDDELPSVRKGALAGLQTITGNRTLKTAESWKRWCEAKKCRKKKP